MKKILNIAHRGASAYELENSFAAFNKAIEMGADMVEMDLHLTKDGEIVIMHDFQLRHTTNGKGRIEDLSYEEIKVFHEKNNEKIPTLKEVIRHTKNKIGLYCELKSFGIEGAFVDTIEEYDYYSQIIAGGFLHPVVKAVKDISKKIKTSVMLGELPVDPVEVARAASADYIHLCWEGRAAHPYELVTAEYIKTIKDAGLGVLIWHEEHVIPMRHLFALDIDGICSNKPDVVSKELSLIHS